jgi:hypothetical protein
MVATGRTVLCALAAALSLGVLVSACGGGDDEEAAPSGGPATAAFVHGVPDVPVDVAVDGETVASDVAPGTISGGFELAAGSHTVELRPVGAAADSEPAVTGTISVAAGADVSVVAYLTRDGRPVVAAFVNDPAPPAEGKARLTVRHTAQADPVDILVAGQPLLANIANGQEAKGEPDPGTYAVSVALAGTTTVVAGPTDLVLEAGQSLIVYAIGAVDQDSVTLIVDDR